MNTHRPRRVTADSGRSPRGIARRMRTGLWVTGDLLEIRPANMDINHLVNLKTWLEENANYYGALLVVHPDRNPASLRGWDVATSNNLLGNPTSLEQMVKATALYQEIEVEIERKTTALAAVAYGRTEAPRQADSLTVDLLEPNPGQRTVVNLDDGTVVEIGRHDITVQATGGNRTTISR